MSLYTKGTWRRYNVESDQLTEGWEKMFSKPKTPFMLSALAGRAILLMAGDTMEASIGINPPDKPRMDCGVAVEQTDIDRYLLPHLAFNLKDETNEEPWQLPEGAELPDMVSFVGEAGEGWAQDPRAFDLYTHGTGVVGFWIVCWNKTDLVDKPSMREDRCASHIGMPFKLLSNEMKKDLFGGEKDWDVVISRKQCPVIMDLKSGDIWLGSGSTKFAKALSAILAQGMGVITTAGELVMGSNKAWPRLALNLLRDKDLYKLERQEAIEAAMKEETEEFEPVDDGASPSPAEVKKLDDDAKDRKRFLSELAAWSPDEGGEVMILQAEASVALNPDALSSVATVTGRDAHELFLKHPKAEIVGCSGSITIPPPSIDTKNGDLATINVDFTLELVQGIYRNLEFSGYRNLWTEMMEEPYVRGLGVNTVVDSTIDDRTHAPRYSRYWFRYYLMLQAFEQRLIHGFASVLELDPSKISVQSRSLFAAPAKTEVQTEGDSVLYPQSDGTRKAAAKMVDALKKNLAPGESVTISSGGKSTTIERDDSFLDDVPFVVD